MYDINMRAHNNNNKIQLRLQMHYNNSDDDDDDDDDDDVDAVDAANHVLVYHKKAPSVLCCELPSSRRYLNKRPTPPGAAKV